MFGDSYAQGNGDWLLTSNKWTNPPFASQHVLHQKLRRDVVTFAQPGAGSIRAMIAKPVFWRQELNSTIFYKLEDPEVILVYFYEGNDLNDNLFEIRRFSDHYDLKKMYDPKDFRKFVDEFFIQKNKMGQQIKPFQWYDNLIFLRCVKRMVRSFKNPKEIQDFRPNLARKNRIIGNFNQALINGKIKFLPDNLEGPSLELSQEELNLGAYVFKESLRYMFNLFPKSKVFVVYIPSVLSCYQVVSQNVNIATNKPNHNIYPSGMVEQRSHLIRNKIKRITEDGGFIFIDTRPEIQKLAQREFIHGPLDWKHFNKDGYEALAEAIIPYLKNLN